MAHARREFVDALELLPKDVRNGSIEMQAVAYFDKLFAYEESFSKMAPDERKAKRLEFSKPILDELYIFAQHANVPPNRQIGKAFQYLLGQWKWLTVWLEDDRLEISNNRAERSIKPFVMGRKNFLFCNTPRGAHSSAVIYSMIETSKENILDPFLYTAEDDGLSQKWSGNVWLNAPYDQIQKFASKLLESEKVTRAIVLTNNATEKKWFQQLLEKASALVFHLGRLRFEKPDGKTSAPMQGQIFFYFGSNVDVFIEEFSRYGFGINLQR